MRNRKRIGSLLAAAAALLAPGRARGETSPVAIPFELANGHVLLTVEVDRRELSFILDTGAPAAIIDRDRAAELGLALGSEFSVHGAGANVTTARVSGATYRVRGLPGFSGAIELAMPLHPMAPALGRDFDGVLGASFIRGFVVELDWESRTLRLHDRNTFVYRGSGAVVPIRLNSSGHPVLPATVTPIGGSPIAGDFVLDLGDNVAVSLRAPFVSAHRLPGPSVKTVPAFAAGAGGPTNGSVGRVASIELGGFAIPRPLTVFSSDLHGAQPMADVAGSVGQRIAERFTVFLDYGRSRLILEPNARFREPDDRAFSGLALQAFGADYRTFRVMHVAPGSAGERAGIREEDVIASIDGRKAAEWTLSAILSLFEKPLPHRVRIRRSGKELEIAFTPGELV